MPDPGENAVSSSRPAATPPSAPAGAAGAGTEEDVPKPTPRQASRPSPELVDSRPPGECSNGHCSGPGVCGTNFVDPDCDEAWSECAPGTHRDFVSGDSCSSCVPDAVGVRSCTWARERYLGFLSELTDNSCADFCEDAKDCSATKIGDNACLDGLVLPLYGMINEEIVMAAESFANENCAALCGSEAPEAALAPTGKLACVNSRCTYVE